MKVPSHIYLVAAVAVISAAFLLTGLNITDEVDLEVLPTAAVSIDFRHVKEWDSQPRFVVHRYVLARPQQFSIVVDGAGKSKILEVSARQGDRTVRRNCSSTSGECELELRDLWSNYVDPIHVEILSIDRGSAIKSDAELVFHRRMKRTLTLVDALTM